MCNRQTEMVTYTLLPQKIYRMMSHSHQARLWIMVLAVCSVTPLIHAADNILHCHNLEYAGPIKEVIEMKPTKLAEKTSNAAKVIQGFATDMASSAIEEIPVVGSVLSTLFGHIVDAYGGGGLDPEDVYNSLKTEIDQLKKYMDQEIVEAKLDYIKKAFGTSHGGILSYAMHCEKTYKGDADDMANCLENLRSMLTQQYHFFVPSADSKVSMLEFSLPMFRMYGELYVDTLLEQIGVARKRGKDTQAVAHTETLIKTVNDFKEHFKTAFEKIAKLHCRPHVMPSDKYPDCAVLPGQNADMCTCILAIGPNKFTSDEVTKGPGKDSKNFCLGIFYNRVNPCEDAKEGYRKKYAGKHLKAIATYWKKQVGDAVSSWIETAKALEPLKANVKR